MAYAVKRILPEAERWDADRINKPERRASAARPHKSGSKVPIRVTSCDEEAEVLPRPVQDSSDPLPRRRGVTQNDLDKYGLTENCPGCLARSRGESA